MGSVEGTFARTSIWRNAFERDIKDSESECRTRLETHFLGARENAEKLVSQISNDIPGLTVHDITHLDALWEMASLVVGVEEVLNPLEVFILGGAILLHDAGMSIAAYPGGLDELRETIEWKDFLVKHYADQGIINPTESELLSPSKSAILDVAPNVLRVAHAKHAEKIAVSGWKNQDDPSETYYIIPDIGLRHHYGELIGQIAASHWWNVSKLEELQEKMGSFGGFPNCWEVRPRLLACILRIADATQIDSRRAPHFLRALQKPKGLSESHWKFQERLLKPVIDGESLSYSSSKAFEVQDSDAWWLCFDTLTMINEELYAVDNFLECNNLPRLKVNKVKGLSRPSDLAIHHIRTKGWQPVNSRLKISNVSHVAEMLGGEKLYGSSLSNPLRELIQNAMDAIRARRKLDGRSDEWGEVSVALEEDDGSHFLKLKDNGLGMSPYTMSNVLVDFGKSIWGSDTLTSEFPGLLSLNVKHTGKFGIGFFSVFMLGEHVCVTSKKYTSNDEAQTLEFKRGLSSDPVLRTASPEELQDLRDNSTVVKVKLHTSPVEDGGLLFRGPSFRTEEETLNSLISRIAPTSDVNIRNINEDSIIVGANDWKVIDDKALSSRLADRLYEENYSFKNIELNGELVGRIRLASYYYRTRDRLTVTVGGLRADSSGNSLAGSLEGVLTLGHADTVSRSTATADSAIIGVLEGWVGQHIAWLCNEFSVGFSSKYQMARSVERLGMNYGGLPIIQRVADYEYYNTEEFIEYLKLEKPESVYFANDIDGNHDDYISEHDYRNATFDDSVYELSIENSNSLITAIYTGLEGQLKEVRAYCLSSIVGASGSFDDIEKECVVLSFDWAE
jgi:Histidine kinase-, DNA gyrase B-, and HSP90-like ATPase